MARHAPPSPDPADPTPAVTPTVTLSPSPTMLPVTGTPVDAGWFVAAAVVFVLVGVTLLTLVGHMRRNHTPSGHAH